MDLGHVFLRSPRSTGGALPDWDAYRAGKIGHVTGQNWATGHGCTNPGAPIESFPNL
jgi:hypothetical protein